MIVTDNTKTLTEALARIETLEDEKAHLLKVIKERKLAGYVYEAARGVRIYSQSLVKPSALYKPVYYISDEFDAAGILITPEVKIET